DIAKAIVAYRGQNRLENLADFLDVTAMTQSQTPPQTPPPGQQGGGQGGPEGSESQPAQPQLQPTGPKLISEELFHQIADDVTTQSETAQYGLININSASVPVLACLPGITQEIAQAIVSHRNSAGYFQNVAGLLRVQGVTREIFEQA